MLIRDGDATEADHSIPYNYLFDSKIWDIVGVYEVWNRKKSNYMVNIKYLRRLQERNESKEFREIFRYILERESEDISKINKLLEYHHKNCTRYFKKIEL
ncbi:MAG: hypothetical protein ACTSRP_02795 [Candidatus Helarchaeota archaeon]